MSKILPLGAKLKYSFVMCARVWPTVFVKLEVFKQSVGQNGFRASCKDWFTERVGYEGAGPPSFLPERRVQLKRKQGPGLP